MKICYISDVIEGFHEKTGGAGQAARRVLNLLSEQTDLSIDVITLPFALNSPTIKNTFFHKIYSFENYFGKTIGAILTLLIPWNLFIYFKVNRLFREIKPDVIHLHHFTKLSFSIISAAKRNNIPLIHSIYDYWFLCPTEMMWIPAVGFCKLGRGKQCRYCLRNRKLGLIQYLIWFFKKPIFSYFLSQIDQFIVLSESSKKILELSGVSSNCIHTIRIPLNFSKKTLIPTPIPNKLLYAGWIQPHKGLHILIQAMNQVIKKVPNTILTIIGSGEENPYYFNNIVSLVNQYKLNSNIVFSKRKNTEEFNQIFMQSSVIIIPEQWENMSPLLLTEAMAASKPVIAANVGGIPELIENNKTGILFDSQNVTMLANKIIWALKNPLLMQKMGKNSKFKYDLLFDNKKILKHLEKEYYSAII